MGFPRSKFLEIHTRLARRRRRDWNTGIKRKHDMGAFIFIALIHMRQCVGHDSHSVVHYELMHKCTVHTFEAPIGPSHLPGEIHYALVIIGLTPILSLDGACAIGIAGHMKIPELIGDTLLTPHIWS